MAQADYGEGGEWFCNSQRPEFERNDYESTIEKFNHLSLIYLKNNVGISLEEKGDYLIGDSLDVIGKKAICLKEVGGIDPDSVEKFSPEVQEVFSANMDKLIETSPALVQYATIPEFGSIVMLILIISIVGVMISTRKLNKIKIRY